MIVVTKAKYINVTPLLKQTSIHSILPQQLKTKIMKWNKEMIIVKIVMLISLLIGFFAAYYYGQSFNRWFLRMDMMDTDYWLTFGIVSSFCLFIGGFIKGRMTR